MKFDAVIFDLDGVITKTAFVHAEAWKSMFDEYLLSRESRFGEKFREFRRDTDYLEFVDGKPRYDGVKSFLSSRNIELPAGERDDSPELETICGLGNRKNRVFNSVLNDQGVEIYESTVNLVKQLKEHNIKVAVASSSKNCREVLSRAGLDILFPVRVDGLVLEELGLRGKPEADIFLLAAERLGVVPGRSVIAEDAVSGVMAGRKGSFGLVVGVAREDNMTELQEAGADLVVNDLGELTVDYLNSFF